MSYQRECVVEETFQPGSIHKEEFFNFWKIELSANDWVLETIKKGYEIPFSEVPLTYEERNNKSARDNMPVVREIVFDMIEKGIVMKTEKKPVCVNPLGLVTKEKDGKVKHRLVWDASRHLNGILEKQKVKLSHLERALEMTIHNDFQSVFDLKSAYYNIKIREHQWNYLGASIDSDDKELFFVYKHLPFGLSSAVHAITKLWKPLVAYINQRGIRFSIYIDDGRILSETKEEAIHAMKFVYETITRAGWILEKNKSDSPGDISQIKKYLGFIIDSRRMRVFCRQR